MAVTWEALTAAQLRAASSRAGSIRTARRMLAIALVLEGADRTTAARLRDGSSDADISIPSRTQLRERGHHAARLRRR